MHIIPSLIPEAVLGTKEPSEKARSAAFDLIVAMGRKMNEGGVVKRSLVDGMEEDGPSVKVCGIDYLNTFLSLSALQLLQGVEEYLTMVAGGLAGASPHMISASVTAISRLVFEFKGKPRQQFRLPATRKTDNLLSLRFYLGADAERDLHNASSLPHLCKPRNR